MVASRKKLLVLAGILVTIIAFYAGYSLYWHILEGNITSVSSNCITIVSNGQSNLPDWVNSCGKGPKVVAVDSSEFMAHPNKYLSSKYPVLIYGSNLRDALKYLEEKMHVRINGTPDAAIVFKEHTIALVYKGANLAFIMKNLPHLSINDSNARTVLAAAPYKGATVITQLSIYRKNTTIYKGILRFVSSYLPKNITFQASLWYNKTHNIAFSEIKTFTTPFTIPPTTCYWDEAMGSSDMLLFSGSNITMGNDNVTIGHTCSRKIGHPVVDAFKLGLTVEEQKGSVIVYPMPNIAPYNSLSIEIYLSK